MARHRSDRRRLPERLPERRRTRVALVAILAVAISLPGIASADDPVVLRGVATAVDGGTVAIDDKTVRLAGILAPGPRQKCLAGNLPWLCGAAARQHLAELIGDDAVACTLERAGLGTCLVGDTDLAAAMVRDGWAVTAADGSDAYRALENDARAARRGMWEKIP